LFAAHVPRQCQDRDDGKNQADRVTYHDKLGGGPKRRPDLLRTDDPTRRPIGLILAPHGTADKDIPACRTGPAGSHHGRPRRVRGKTRPGWVRAAKWRLDLRATHYPDLAQQIREEALT